MAATESTAPTLASLAATMIERGHRVTRQFAAPGELHATCPLCNITFMVRPYKYPAGNDPYKLIDPCKPRPPAAGGVP